MSEFQDQIAALTREKEASLKDAAESKLQLSMADEQRQQMKSEVGELNSRLRDKEAELDKITKELIDHKRMLQEETREKDTQTQNNEELRNRLKASESERLENKKFAEDATGKAQGEAHTTVNL